MIVIRHACLLTLLAATALAAASPLQAQALAYRLDPVHTRVLMSVEHAGFSNALGTVSGSSGWLWFDADDWSSARLHVQVPLQRLDFGDEAWNKATLAPNLLDAQRHPEAVFIADQAVPIGAQQARVCGQLQLRGQRGPVCLDVRFNQLRRHPLPPFRQTIGFSARGQLSRSDFGIRAWPGLIGDVISLQIEVEAVRDTGAPAPPASTDDNPTSHTTPTGEQPR